MPRFPAFAATILALSACAAPDHLDLPSAPTPDTEEVVFPQAVEVQPPTRIHGAAASTVWELDLDGHVVRLDLTENTRLFAADYREYRLGPDGELLPHAKSDWANQKPCWFQGTVTDEDTGYTGSAAVRTCGKDGLPELHGQVRWNGGIWMIAPMDGTASGVHKMARTADDATNCAVHDAAPTPDTIPAEDWFAGQNQSPPPGARKVVELLLVNDGPRTNDLGNNTENDAMDIANIVDDAYFSQGFSPEVRIVVKGQVTYPNGDPFSPTKSGGNAVGESLLREFDDVDWLNTIDTTYDHRHLLTHRWMADGVQGIAWVGTMCSTWSSSGVTYGGMSDKSSATVMAHEMGHTFSAPHDGEEDNCPPSGFIMGADATATMMSLQPEEFSSCSVGIINDYLQSDATACLDNEPTEAYQASCGNGIVEDGEQCDCGKGNCEGIDPCCNGYTCQLAADAECSADDACCLPGSCQIAGSGTVCREAHFACDAPATCDGVSAECPSAADDVMGQVCELDVGGAGACYDDECVGWEAQCATIGTSWYGEAAETDACETLRSANPCGALMCEDPSGACVVFPLSNGPDVIEFTDGTPCGDDSQCYDGECVPTDLIVSGGDMCPNDPAKRVPGWCGCGQAEDPTDTDSDGTPDCADPCPTNPSGTDLFTCPCTGADADGDGTQDCHDACPTDRSKTAPGVCGCGTSDADSDGDGTADCVDTCPADSAKTLPGECGCGRSDTDSDGDGLADCLDLCPDDGNKQYAGICGCGKSDKDSDGDGNVDCKDDCPNDRNDNCDIRACAGCMWPGNWKTGATGALMIGLAAARRRW